MKTKTIPSWGILSDPVGNDEGGKYTNPEPRTWIYGRKTLLSHTSFGAAAAADRGRVNVCGGDLPRLVAYHRMRCLFFIISRQQPGCVYSTSHNATMDMTTIAARVLAYKSTDSLDGQRPFGQ